MSRLIQTTLQSAEADAGAAANFVLDAARSALRGFLAGEFSGQPFRRERAQLPARAGSDPETHGLWLEIATLLATLFLCGLDRNYIDLYFAGRAEMARRAAETFSRLYDDTSDYGSRAHTRERGRRKRDRSYTQGCLDGYSGEKSAEFGKALQHCLRKSVAALSASPSEKILAHVRELNRWRAAARTETGDKT